jgi:hypothetical protein
MKTAIGAAVALYLLSVPVAHAGSIRETLDEFGFMGSWAQDCDRPADRENVWREVTPTDDGARFTESLGAGFVPSSYRVLAAKRSASDTIVLSIELNGHIQQDLTMVRRGDRIRTMVNQPLGAGAPVVSDGVVTANGLATPWLTRCELSRQRALL